MGWGAPLDVAVDPGQEFFGGLGGTHGWRSTPKVSTVGGMAAIAGQGDLYFDLHTTGQTFYGDIRGQILPPP
jgi:hypothetical protein